MDNSLRIEQIGRNLFARIWTYPLSFELYNAGRPMELLIESLGNEERKIGLSEESLQAAAESRLRAARLYTEDWKRAANAYLYVNVNVVGPAYSISVKYEKRTTDAFG